jgi:hypothetical protein
MADSVREESKNERKYKPYVVEFFEEVELPSIEVLNVHLII